MVDIVKISPEEFEKEMALMAEKGQWVKLLADIKEDGEPRKVTGLTRGQVAAVYRRARDEGFRVKTSYKAGHVIISL